MARQTDSEGRPLLSATQVDKFRECPRKWAWEYLAKIKSPPSSGQRLGTRLHSIQEAWLLNSQPPDVMEEMELAAKDGHMVKYFPGQIAQAGLHLLPPPGSASVESCFIMSTAESSWVGYLDFMTLVDAQGQCWYPDPVVAQMPDHDVVVGDHKTTREWKWAKTVEDLRADIQANLYAAAAMEAMAKDRTKSRWIYYKTTGRPEARAVDLIFNREDVSKQVEGIDRDARDIHRLYVLQPNPLDLPPNPDACERFGGCPHVNRCNLTVVERMQANRAMETMDQILARKRAERDAREGNGAGAVPPPAPPPPPMAAQAPPPPPEAPPPPPVVWWKPGDPYNEAQAYMAGKGARLFTVAMAADNPPPPEVGLQYEQAALVPPPPTDRTHINPPEAPPTAPASPADMPPPPPPKPGSAPVQDDLSSMDREALKKLAIAMGVVDSSCRLREEGLRDTIRQARATGGFTQVVASQPIVAGQAVTQAQVAPPAPPQALATGYVPPPPAPAPAPVDAFVQGIQDRPPPAPLPPAPPAHTTGTPQEDKGGFFLLENCAFTSTNHEAVYMTLEQILAEVLPELERDHGVADWRLAEYGKGPGYLAQYVEAFVSDLGADVTIQVDTKTPEGQAVVATLRRLAGNIIRAF